MATTIHNTNQERVEFFETLFGTNEGYVCIAVAEAAKTKQKFREKFFKWPADVVSMMSYIKGAESGHNVWFCAQLLDQPERRKSSIHECYALWADLDTCHPSKVEPAPSVILESSEGRYQAFWPLEEPIAGVQAEDYSARIAYAHQNDGADISGWDLTQLLRVPYTFNYKYRTRPQVLLQNLKQHFAPSAFTELPEVELISVQWQPPPSRSLNVDTVLAKYRIQENDALSHLVSEEPDHAEDWSRRLWKLLMGLFEIGMNKTEVYSVASHSACNKFMRDGRPERLWDDVLRAESNYVNSHPVIFDDTAPPLLIDPEVKWEPGFVEEYIEYASAVTDAPVQYHEACAFMLLSAYLSSNLVADTNVEEIKTNLWFCILGETTLSRKTTAMNIAMKLLDEDLLLATEEGSMEGMLEAMRGRQFQASVFYRDEVVGMMKAVLHKRYLAGMLESMTSLYDGKTLKRVLRRDTIYVRDPVFIMLCGGIRQSFMETLDDEHLTSGFLPRMMYVVGDVDTSKLRPLFGPTTERRRSSEHLHRTLQDMRMTYDIIDEKSLTKDPLPGTSLIRKCLVHARGDESAFTRWNEFNETLLEFGQNHGYPNFMLPMMVRFAMSVLKMAVLLAGTEQIPEQDEHGDYVIDYSSEHIEHAIYYARRWLPYTLDVVKHVGVGKRERVYDRIVDYVERNPGCFKSEIMRSEHLNAAEIRDITDTLVQRMEIQIRKEGQLIRLYPYGV